MVFEIWNIEKGFFRPHLEPSELITLCNELPINYNSKCFLYCFFDNQRSNDIRKKLQLYFDIFYEFNIQVTYSNVLGLVGDVSSFVSENGKILDLSTCDYFLNELDPASIYLIEAISNLKERNIIDGIPKLIMWLDKYHQKDSSGFCDIRNCCIHPDLYAISRKNLEKKYPQMLDFDDDDSLKRNSGNNTIFLKSIISKLIKEIKPHFVKRFFEGKSLVHECGKNTEYFKNNN